ncbi:MAG: hypothetical protein QM759_13210 [Terricaulis sp.]
MLGRLAATMALVALAGCAGMEPAGRTAQREAEASRPAPVMPPSSRELPPPTHATAPPPRMVEAAPAPPPPVSPPVTSAPVTSAPVTTAQAQAPTPSVAAPQVAVPVPPRPTPQDPNDVIVHGSTPEQQVRPPNGDPRSLAERREDIQNWDHCVMQVMAQQSDPNQVETQSPEDVCSRRLGQASRNALPQSRIQRPRL